MAVFPSFNLTKKGEELLNRSIGEGRVLTFTKFKLGDGVPTEDWRDLVNVQSSFKEFPVLETAIQADQVLRIRGYFDNKGFATDKQFKEIGIFVTLDGVAGEHLYSYTNAGDTGDIIPAESRGFYSRTLDVNNYIGYATNITFNIEQTRDNFDFNTENELKVATFLKKGDKIRLWGRLVLGDIETLNYIVTDEVTSFILDNGLYCKLAGDNTVSNIKTDLVNLKGAVVGDVVEVLGFHAKGDGSHHKRIAKDKDDGSGEQGQNGIWWCVVKNSESYKKENKTYIENNQSIGTHNRDAFQKSYHFFGDSHTYGQGTRGDFGPFKTSTHATRYGARTWSTMLKDTLNFMWGQKPRTLVGNGVGSYNKILEIDGFNIEKGKRAKENYVAQTSFTNQDNLNLWTRNTSNLGMFNYNATTGFYPEHYTVIQAEENLVMGETINSFSTPSIQKHFTKWDDNGRWCIAANVVRLDGRPVAELPYIILPSTVLDADKQKLLVGKSFELAIKGGIKYTPCFVEHVVVSDEGLVCIGFSYADGTLATESNLKSAFTKPETFATLKVFDEVCISATVDVPSNMVGFSLCTGPSQYHQYEVSYDPSLYYGETSNSYGDQLFVNTSFRNKLLKKLTNSTAGIVSAGQEGVTQSSDGAGWKIDGRVMVEDPSNPNKFEFRYYYIYGDAAQTGTIRIRCQNKFNGAYRDNLTNYPPSILTRGFQLNSQCKIMTHGFGCHSIGDLVGRTTDICNHDTGIYFDHIEEMKKCEIIRRPSARHAVLQAPLVNEYLRQTTIANYTADLDLLYKKLFEDDPTANTRFIIFTGAGQLGHDDYLGPITTSNPISYAMYRQATKDWCKAKNVTYVDAGAEQKRLIESGEAIPSDFLMSANSNGSGAFDSNHPTMYAHMLWYEALKNVVLRKFQ
ncbi:MAG: hypothetical protein ACRCX2_27165 [Paraclostridium sp.]